MTVFWVAVALASVLAIALVLLPLRVRRRSTPAPVEARTADNLAAFRAREAELAADLEAGLIDADTHAAMHADLARQLLADTRAPESPAAAAAAGADWRLPLVACALVPVVALLIYLPRGALDDLQLAAEVRAAASAAAAGGADADGDGAAHADADTQALMQRLRARLVEQPDDADGWFLLGRTAMSVGAFPVAVQAFERLRELAPGEPAVAIYLVQARYLADGRQETDRVREAAEAVLAVDPNEPITREILAMTAFQRGEYRSVVEHLQHALAGNVDPARRTFLEQGLAVARQRLGLPVASAPGAPAAVGAAATAAAAANAGIDVEVSLAPALAGRFPAETTVFVLARPPGGRMPLAVVRRTLADLPLRLRLDDSMAMSPAMTLSSVPQAEVVARISPGGSAMRGDDDVEVVAAAVNTDGGQAAKLVLGGGSEVVSATPAGHPTVAADTAGAPALPGASDAPDAAGSDTQVAVKVLVELSPELAGSVSPDTAVFVFAREVDGPPAPLAARRLRVADLPALITLTEADAMLPQRTLASAERVRVGARVSRGGGVTARPGDLEGLSVAFAAADVQRVIPVVIDRRIGS